MKDKNLKLKSKKPKGSGLVKEIERDGKTFVARYRRRNYRLSPSACYAETRAALVDHVQKSGVRAGQFIETAVIEKLRKEGYEIPSPDDDFYIEEKSEKRDPGRPMKEVG